MTPLALIAFIPCLLSAALLPYALKHRTTPGATPLALSLLAVTVWAFSYAVAILPAVDPTTKVFFIDFQYVGIVIVPMAWIAFAFEYTGKPIRLTRRTILLLAIEPVITVTLNFTNTYHLMRGELTNVMVGPFVVGISDPGLWFWIHAAYAYAWVLWGTVLIFQAFRRSSQIYKRQAFAILLGAAVAWASNFISIFRLSPIPDLDLTSFAFTVTMLIWAWALFRYRLLDIAPVAHDVVFKSMVDIVIVIDQSDRIADINPAGQQVIGRTAAAIIGQPIESALANWPDLVTRCREKRAVQEEITLANVGEAGQHNYDLRITPISDRRDQVTGRLVVLRDITESRLVKALSDSEQHLRQRAEQLQAMAEIIQAITAIQELDQLLPTLPQLISQRFGFYHVGVFLLADDGQAAVLTAANSEAGQRLVAQNYRLEVDQTNLASDVIRGGKTQVLTDASRPTSFLHHADLPQTQSEITLPLKTGERVIGALDLQSRLATPFTTDEDLVILGTLANQVAIVIENARLFAQQTRLAEENRQLLERAETAIGELDDLTHRLTGERWEKYLADQRDELVSENVRPGSPMGRPDLAEIDQAIEQRELVISAGSGRQALALPIVLRGQVIGALGLEEDQPGQDWAEDGTALMREMAERISLALDNAQLFEEARIRAEELTVLNELSQALNARLSVDQVLAQVYTGLSRLIDTTNFYIALYNPTTHTISFPINVTESVTDQRITTISADQGLTGYILRTRTSLLLKDGVSRWQEQMGLELVGQSAQSWLGVPMLTGGQIIGIMAVQNYRMPGVYDEHDRDLLAAVANQTAIAIQNARLFEETQRTVKYEQTLRQVTTRIRSSNDPETIMRTAIRELGSTLGRQTFIRLGDAEQLSRPITPTAEIVASGDDHGSEGGQ